MNNFAIQLYRITVPKYFRRKIQAKKLPRTIFNYYINHPEKLTPEIELILNYLKTNPIAVYPYTFQNQYHPEDIEVFYDKKNGLRYVLMNGKKLYFKKRWNVKRIKKAYSILLKEQDNQSPHRYLSEQFQFDEGDVLVDAGAAEGNFALSLVEKTSRIILFEPDKEWIEPLEATFEPWKHKVTIINKFVGDSTNSNQITLDNVISPITIGIFLKVDVEGAELKLLKGATQLLSQQKPFKIAICTYHREQDEKEISEFLRGYNFKISFSDGYMLPIFDKKMRSPYFFRRGLIRAKK